MVFTCDAVIARLVTLRDVHLSVCHIPVLYLNEYVYPQIFAARCYASAALRPVYSDATQLDVELS